MLAETSCSTSVIAPFIGLLGVAVGGGITLFTQKISRKNDRLRDQLREFYSPLLGIHFQIKAKSEVRRKVTSIAHESWPNGEKKKQRDEEESAAYAKLFDYNNSQLINELVPLYRKMLDYFTEHMWLAEQSTIAHYPVLVEFVEIWNRFLGGSLPKEALNSIEHKESNIFPFYEDLKSNFARLKAELKEEDYEL